MKHSREDKFWANYNHIKKTKKLLESEKEKIFTKKEISLINRTLYDSFKGIQKGDYQKVYSKLGKILGYSTGTMNIVHTTFSAYLNAYHLTIPHDIFESYNSLKFIKMGKKALESLVESFYCGPEKTKRCGAGGGMN